MEGIDRGFLDRAVHVLGLPVCPGVIELGQLVDDTVFIADSAKEVHAQKRVDGFVSVLGPIGKSHAVVGQHGVNPVSKGFDHTARKVRAVHLAPVVPEFNAGELGDPVNGQKHVALALGHVNVHATHFTGCELAPATDFDVTGWQP